MISSSAVVLAALGLFAAREQWVSGLVEDAAGKPLAGVRIWLSRGWTLEGTTPTLARGTTDSHGRFRIAFPFGVPGSRPALEMLSVWAYQPGAAAGRVHVSLSSEGDHDEVRIALPSARSRQVTLLRPDGKPLQGATIKPAALAPSNAKIVRFYLGVPDELGDLLAVRTNQEGSVEIPYLDENAAPLCNVTTADLGVQQIQLQQFQQTGNKPIVLRPVGRVVGRVVADDPAAARGIVFYLGTQFDGKDSSGRAHARTDNEGRFTVPALAEGSMLFMVHASPGSPYRPAQGSMTKVVANQENRLEIQLQRAVHVGGTVRERGTNRPVPGTGVMIGSQYQMNVAYSDDQGHFEDYVVPGTISLGVYPWMAPRPFFPLAQQPVAEVEIPANVTEFTLKPIELRAATC